MESPQFFKYLDLNGAWLTLRNRTFRHAKPSNFNDCDDLTVGGVFENHEQALSLLPATFIDTLASNLELAPTCASPMREAIQRIQKSILENPEVVEAFKNENAGNPVYGDTQYFYGMMENRVREINEFMQNYRVLCVTTSCTSERMWQMYAQNHQGIALKIKPNLEKYSKFSLFKPVEYTDKRPPLYQTVEEFVHGSVFGNHESRYKEMCEKIIFSKTREWEDENEYRLAIPIIDEEPWETLGYHPEELVELYLGVEMEVEEKGKIASQAREVNPSIEIYSMFRLDDGELDYSPYGA